jgi:hypothetical protein
MECGVDDKIISVEEPETCVYEMRFITPAACSPAADPANKGTEAKPPAEEESGARTEL